MDEFVLTTARKPMEERETEREREGAPPDESSELFFFSYIGVDTQETSFLLRLALENSCYSNYSAALGFLSVGCEVVCEVVVG